MLRAHRETPEHTGEAGEDPAASTERRREARFGGQDGRDSGGVRPARMSSKDRPINAKLAELDGLYRESRIRERLASLKSIKEA